MRTLIKVSLCILFCFAIEHTAGAVERDRKVCVLNFERPEHPMSGLANKLFRLVPGVTLYQMAVPTDFLKCIADRSDEIVIMGHALEEPAKEPDKPPRISLAYFRDLPCKEREQAISNVVSQLSERISEIDAYLANHPDEEDYERESQQSKLSRYRQELVSQRKEYETLPASEPYYVKRSVLPYAMQLARNKLAEQARQPEGVALKRIRLMLCLPNEVLAHYEDLRGLITDNKIELDIAPKNRFLSFIYGKTITSPDRGWLAKSLPIKKTAKFTR